jgi:type III restriction enzyme
VKIELKQFQKDAARKMLGHIESAWFDTRHGHSQAIILSSPTGSGKTATVNALLEWICQGHDSCPPDPHAVFLWLSDSPELNEQSRDKILRQSSVFFEHDLITIEPPFSQERLEAGRIYFLNTQKLGKENLLTKPGDGQQFTIWQTIQNTAEAAPGHFYVIIDEAHRGMTQKPSEIEQATTIVQRFIKGYPEGGLEPLSLIIGMSATPQRFENLLQGTGRVPRKVEISPADVKVSGLLKDRIVLDYPDDDQPADWSLLEQSVRHWQRFTKEWEAYCAAQNLETAVAPAFVIQVESGTKDILTHTDLPQLVRVVERVTGPLPDEAWAHAFQEDQDIQAGGRIIRKIEASKIEGDPARKIVLFKMSLSTGWDCPRAEVMMSFRRAQDYTYIAQLVGRMVRTPLARSIETNELLNTVSLFLPHYDEKGLKAILGKLNNPDPDIGLPVEAVRGKDLAYLEQDPSKAALFHQLGTLRTYRVERMEKSAPIPRLMRLARQLTAHDELDKDAYAEAKALIVSTLTEELHRLSASPDFIGNVNANQEIVLREVWVEYGEWRDLSTPKTEKIPATPENVDDLFRQCDRLLGNEGLHMDFWRSRHDPANPMKAKLELYGILRDGQAWKHLSDICQGKLNDLFQKYEAAIAGLTTSRQEVYNRIRRSAKDPAPEALLVSPTIAVPKAETLADHHLYVAPDGTFRASLNAWETAVLQSESDRPDFSGWFRNFPRKDWALCIPYKFDGEWRPLFPDLLSFRQVGGKSVVDILDPHNSDLPDSVAKAKGLIEYAKRHGHDVGRIEFIVKDDSDHLRRLDLKNADVQTRIMALKDTEPGELTQIFSDLG